MKFALVLIVSYLFGSIPWALVIGKVFYKKDIRKEGSGNLGASNAGRVLGKHVAIIVTLLDAFKAFFSMLFAYYVCQDAMIYAGLVCAFGHCFPIFAGFKGGKAVATTYGFLLGIATLMTHQYFFGFFFPILCFFAILYLTRMVSVASMSSILIEAITSFVMGNDISISISILVLFFFVSYRHKSNIARIKNGTENKIKWMGKVK